MISASSSAISSSPFNSLYPYGANPPFHLPSLAFCLRPSIVCTRIFSRSISATADRTEIISLPLSLELSIPSSTQIKFTPKSCILCKELSTSAAFLPKRDNLYTKTNSTRSLPSSISRSICINSCRPSILFPDFPSSEYSPTITIS